MSKWEKVKLEDIAEIIMGQSPDSKYYNDTEQGYKFLQGCSEFGSTYPNAKVYCTVLSKLAPINSILFSVRAPVGKINIADTNYCIGRGLAAIVPKKVNFIFLLYYLHILEKHYQNISQGTTFSAIGTKELKSFNISLPPFPIQSRIAEILSTVDKAIEDSEKLIAKYKRMKTGMMQDLLTKGIDENGNIRSEATHKFKDSPLGRIPVEWEVDVFGKYSYIKGRIGWRGLKSDEYKEEGPYLIAGNHIIDSRVVWDACQHINLYRYNESPEIQLQLDDIIISKDGTIGRVAYINFLPGLATINSTMMLLRITNKEIFNRFIFYYLQGEYFSNIIKEKISGSGVPHLFQRDMKSLLLPIIDFQEQINIAKMLISLENQIINEITTLSKLRLLKIGLMNDLLSGKVELDDSGELKVDN
jgi:type I restriction enzyme S subunit